MSGARRATAADAQACATILSDWIDGTDWMPRLHTRAEDRAFLARLIETQDVAVAPASGAVKGFIAVDGHEITALYVAENARRQGIGQTLMALAKSADHPLNLWVFQANDAALAFYDREGFWETERTEGARNAAHLPDVKLRWEPDT